MKKVYLVLVVLAIFCIMILSINPSFARGSRPGHHYHNGIHYDKRSASGHKPYDYDREFLNKMIKHNNKAIKIAKKYLDKVQKLGSKQALQDIITSRKKDVERLKELQVQWYGDFK